MVKYKRYRYTSIRPGYVAIETKQPNGFYAQAGTVEKVKGAWQAYIGGKCVAGGFGTRDDAARAMLRHLEGGE